MLTRGRVATGVDAGTFDAGADATDRLTTGVDSGVMLVHPPTAMATMAIHATLLKFRAHSLGGWSDGGYDRTFQ